MKCVFGFFVLIFVGHVASKSLNFNISLPENDSNTSIDNQIAEIVIRTGAYFKIVGTNVTDRNVVHISPTTTTTEATTTTISPEKRDKLNKDLLNATQSGDIDAVKKAIAEGADVDTKDENGYTALHKAAYRGNLQIVEYLIAKKANVNARNNYGSSALDIAIEWGLTEVAKVLKDAGGKSFEYPNA